MFQLKSPSLKIVKSGEFEIEVNEWVDLFMGGWTLKKMVT